MNEHFSRAEEHRARGIRLTEAGLFNEAIAEFKQAIALHPDCLEAYSDLGKAYNEAGSFDLALEACFKLLERAPALLAPIQNIAKTYGEMGRLNEALSYYYKLLERDPDRSSARSDLLLTLNYTSASREMIFFEHAKFSRFDAFSEDQYRDFKPNKKTKITIGYVSADFRDHPVAYLIAPILKHHDRSRFDIVLYNNGNISDAETEKFKKLADIWRDTEALSDTDLIRLIKADGIDILVDLSGHTGGNRLSVFARKPAPLQVSWIGYMNTAGLKAIDYRITDLSLAPEGAEAYYLEKLWRVRDSFTFDHSFYDLPPPLALPARKNGFVTFASMNNYKKVSDRLIDVWVRILKEVPNARLVVSAKGDERFQASIRERFTSRGIAPARIDIVGLKPHREYIALFDTVDIALDTFPFSGLLTIYHGLWSGVPSVVLEGAAEYGRNAATLMKKVNLPEFIATSEDEYVAIAVRYANDLESLERIRPDMRKRFDPSEAALVTKDIEQAYLGMLSEKFPG